MSWSSASSRSCAARSAPRSWPASAASARWSRFPRDYRHPVLVSGTDGVGTKLRLAIDTGRHRPSASTWSPCAPTTSSSRAPSRCSSSTTTPPGSLDVEVAASVIDGIAEGCAQAGAALVGGETAEMPGMYHGDDYDLAGFCVGVVEREAIIDGSRDTRGRRGHRPRLERAAFQRLFADPQAHRSERRERRDRSWRGDRCSIGCSRPRASTCASLLGLLRSPNVPARSTAWRTSRAAA